ncbi:hypothetical protein QWY77_08210 [Thalassotalea ponticola]|uniref:hypothetical protein n=1 Tax=Thalassotalea ponticola TaxID=1523392 RepID=UPI0025B4EDE4|nr:hypothetical protein [Thalassotalea ponticola]MDN3652747.1 hypothetical protein [Thalassotalea ponticola]
MKKASLNIFILCLFSVVGCGDRTTDVSACSGSVKQGHIFVSISADNKVSIGKSKFSKELLYQKQKLLMHTCESVAVMIQADKEATHKVVFETIKEIESLNINVVQ